MPGRVVVLVGWVAFVIGLAVYVTTSRPRPNDIVYRYETVVEVSVEVADPGFAVTVAGVPSRQLEAVGVGHTSAAGVVVTVTPTTDAPGPTVSIDTYGATLTGHDDHEVWPTTARGDEVISTGVPTVVMLTVMQPAEVIEGSFNYVSTSPTVPVEVAVPIRRDEEVIATMTAVMSPVGLTGDDLGITGIIDLPDQRLPRPAAGEVIPTKLADGRPVWMVGLDGTVAVLDARSPHRYSGLVGWCGSMPGFTDSIGSSRFAPSGQYRFGPAPHGLIPYAVEVADDHVTITHRLPPPPRPQANAIDVDQMAPIEGSAGGQDPYCDNDTDIAEQAGEAGAMQEDFTADPTWVQHDLADWPPLEDATGDGWFRTDEHNLLDGGPHLVGDLLVHRERGVIVDAASPPGTARTLDLGTAAPMRVTVQFAQTGPTVDGRRSIVVQSVMWVTPTGIAPADAPPDHPDRHLVSTQPSASYLLADDVEVDVRPGDVVTLTVVDQQVTDIALVS